MMRTRKITRTARTTKMHWCANVNDVDVNEEDTDEHKNKDEDKDEDEVKIEVEFEFEDKDNLRSYFKTHWLVQDTLTG